MTNLNQTTLQIQFNFIFYPISIYANTIFTFHKYLCQDNYYLLSATVSTFKLRRLSLKLDFSVSLASISVQISLILA